jgi:hypothetical protein
MEVLFDVQPEPLAERIVVRVYRDGRHRGCAAGGVVVDRQRRILTRNFALAGADLSCSYLRSGLTSGRTVRLLRNSLTPWSCSHGAEPRSRICRSGFHCHGRNGLRTET